MVFGYGLDHDPLLTQLLSSMTRRIGQDSTANWTLETV
jgi:hypothetical protein